MKIAYCIQCHKESGQINYLLDTLDDENNYFFIHVDKKKNFLRKEIKKNKRVFILDECIDVKWGQISQTQATLLLFNAIKKTGMYFDYIWLISGQCFPIKPNEYIHEYLKSNNGCNFISISSENRKLYKRNEIYFPLWTISNNYFQRIIRYLWVFISGGYRYTFPFFQRKNVIHRIYFFGSSWFTITYDCMCFILTTIETEPAILKFYRNTFCPDESLFHTIIMNSCYVGTIRKNLVYTDWANCKNHPKTLDVSDFQNLINTPKLVARKFINLEIIKKYEAYKLSL